MGCLNKKLPINLHQMKTILLNEINYIIDDKLYFLDVIFECLKKELKNDEDEYNNKIKKLKDNIIKEIRNKFNCDNFIYRIIDNNHCGFKHKRGKRDQEFCCKKITKNGNKDKYVCTTHNKDHIPNKRKDKNDLLLKINDKDEIQNNEIPPGGYLENKNIETTKNRCEKIVNDINYNISSNISLEDKTVNDINNTGKINKKIKIDLLKNSYINNPNKSNSLSVCLKNIICKYNNNSFCYNIEKYGNCKFKHINKELDFKDFIIKNNSTLSLYV